MADNGLDKFVTGLFAGALVGAALGLLLAPKPGKETRQIVRERAGEYLGTARARAEEYIGPARERAEGYVGTARERVRNLRRSNNQEEIEGNLATSQVIEEE